MRGNKLFLAFQFVVLSVILVSYKCHGLAVMSIDIGSEWMKVAIVSPGVPMEIALNSEFKRKTPATIAFRNGERTFGAEATTVGVMYPPNSFSYLLDLLGKSIDNPMVKLYQKRFPYYDIVTDETTQGIAFKLNSDISYSAEELMAQLLKKAKQYAQITAGPKQKVNEAVITVPGYFNQVERKAMIRAAELAGIRVLQLINDYTAVALNYGIFHKKNINESVHYVMFYDMGASSTSATIVGYQIVKSKEKRFPESQLQLSIMGVGYDRTLGGIEFQIRLQKYLAEQFDALKVAKGSVFDNKRAMAKLFKEAGRVKMVLSANADHYAQIEGLLEEKDFRHQVTRQKFEELCEDLFERVSKPVQTALDMSGLSLELISQVVLVGAGTRVPKVQEKLTEFVKKDLAKNLNTDEAAAMGAVYKAADLSQGFEVMKFNTKDTVLFPIQIVFKRSSEKGMKEAKKTLFSKTNAYPQKKIITFNKHNQDFSFNVNYAELDYLPQSEVEAIGNLNISTVSLTGVADVLAKHAKEGAESKGIKAHFVMDESGILNLLNVELVSEKEFVEPEKDVGSDKEATEKDGKDDVKPVHEEPEDQKVEKEDAKSKNESETKDEKPSNQTEKEDKKEKEKKATPVVMKEPIETNQVLLGPTVDLENLDASRKKLEALDLYDMQKARRESALNSLESFVIDAQQKLETEEYKAATTPEEAEKIIAACSKTSEWLYEEGFDATAEVYEDKLAELKKLTNDLYERVFEHKERPEALAGMVSLLNASKTFMSNMKNLNFSSEMFTAVELTTLEKAINETQNYHDTVVSTVNKTPLNEPVIYKVRDIANKMALLDREVQYLVSKAKIWQAKQDLPPVSKTNSTEGSKEKTKEKPSTESPAAEETEKKTEAKPEELPAPSTEETHNEL